MGAKESLHWTERFFSDPEEHSKYGKFTPAQKNWLDKAWREFCGGKIPDVFAVFAHQSGFVVGTWQLSDGQKIEWHHINPGQDSLAHGENPDLPENAVPLVRNLHSGISDDPIHPDINEAKKNWRQIKSGQITDSFAELRQYHRIAAARGEIYWDNSYDEFFRELAQKVSSAYRKNHPEHPWPDKR